MRHAFAKESIRPWAQDLRAQDLCVKAARCRRLAHGVEGDPACLLLARLADLYEDQARALALANETDPPPSAFPPDRIL